MKTITIETNTPQLHELEVPCYRKNNVTYFFINEDGLALKADLKHTYMAQIGTTLVECALKNTEPCTKEEFTTVWNETQNYLNSKINE